MMPWPRDPASDALRNAAEARLLTNPAKLTTADAATLVHELQVHQVELQMQNEELRRAQVSLDVARARWFDLYEMAPCGYATVTLQGLIAHTNLTAATLFETPRTVLEHQPFSQYIHVTDRPRWYRLVELMPALGRPGALEVCMVRGDGRTWHAHLAVTLGMTAERAEEFRVAITDITARTEAERSAQETRGLLDTVLDAIPSYVFSIDRSHRLTIVNTAMAVGHSLPKSEMLGHTVDDLYPADVASTIRTADERVMSSGLAEPQDTVVLRGRDGVTRTAIVSRAPLRDAHGTVTGLAGVATDVTAHRDAEAAQARLAEQVQQMQRMESIGRLAGGVAHDFNNQLGVILGNAEMALLRLDPSRPEYEGIAEIRDAALRSSHLTRQLLTFARRQAIQPMVLELNETVARVLGMLRRLIGEHIELVWRPGADICPVRIDAAELEQILTNLTLNARDAIGGRGVITVSTAAVTLDNEWCARHPEVSPGEFAQLTVMDDGCGMSSEVMAKVFEPFFTTKPVGEGTGLGLASVYGAVRQCGGVVTVESAVGAGTTFAMHFPHAGHHSPRVANGAGTDALPHGTETILLLEDEETVRRLTSRLLERSGYRVLAAESPAAATAMMQQHGTDIALLLTDVVMPGMDGPSLAETLRASFPHLRVLLMSGYAANVGDGAMISLDGVPFIAKPFTMAGLLTEVRAVLDRPVSGMIA